MKVQEKLSPEIGNLTPVDQLLYLSGLPSFSSEEPEKMSETLKKAVAGDELLKKIRAHRLLPRFYLLVRRNQWEGLLPRKVWQEIEAGYYGFQASWVHFETLLENLILNFNHKEVETLLLKGAALVFSVYQNNPVRGLSDIDLLIHETDRPAAESLLGEAGYQKQEIDIFPSRWHAQLIGPALAPNASVWTHREKKITLDLHVRPFDNPAALKMEPDWLWQDAVPATVGKAKTRLPSPDRQFLHLLFHLVKHRGSRERDIFMWYLDLDECLRFFNGKLDGRFLAEAVRAQPSAGRALALLGFLQNNLFSPLPSELRQLIDPNPVSSLGLREILSTEPRSELSLFNDRSWTEHRENFLALLGKTSGVRQRALFFWKWLFPEPQYLKRKYRFKRWHERLAARFLHLIEMFRKGVSIGGYWLERKRPAGG